ncbi:MAG: hypothetical protein P8Z79_04280 [Sedimentisphaerales bacterium]|jgi:hypothetical protein
MAVKSQLFEGKKYMWDGHEYDDKKKAAAAEKEYREKGFDVRTCSEDGKIVVYTRRVATEIELT